MGEILEVDNSLKENKFNPFYVSWIVRGLIGHYDCVTIGKQEYVHWINENWITNNLQKKKKKYLTLQILIYLSSLVYKMQTKESKQNVYKKIMAV